MATKLAFLDRHEELGRLRRLFTRTTGTLGVLFGRRRCGKSRLIREALPIRAAVYYVGDDREGALQRAALAREIARLVPGFHNVLYPGWEALFDRWWREAPPGSVLALDEFPALVTAAREVPSLLQKHLDRGGERGLHLVLAGSSQAMMQGLVLDRSAPLFGRGDEILKIGPLPAGWIARALRIKDPIRAIESYATWGGVPRYWELAAEHPDLDQAVRSLILSPLGVLHEEPVGLLRDDLRDTTQAASVLSLIGQGCHRPSELAALLGKPATSLARPLQRLVELDLVGRDVPFGVPLRDAKRGLYSIADPFLRFWFRFVEPNRSRLEAGLVGEVARDVARSFAGHVAGVWEELARATVPRVKIHGRSWNLARRWWGNGLDRRPLEIDVVADGADRDAILLGEVKWERDSDPSALIAELRRKAERFPGAQGKQVHLALWLRAASRSRSDVPILTPVDALRVMR